MATASPDRTGSDVSRTRMAAERTWLAWWRTALAATVGSLAIGRVAPEALRADAVPYAVLGCGYAVLALALLAVGARRQRALERALETGEPAPLPSAAVRAFTVGGGLLALMTLVLVAFQA
jgi:putative membrane protein